MFDPDTNESLGILEEVRGKGIAVHVQYKLTTIESDQIKNEITRTIKKSNSFEAARIRPLDSEEEIITPTKKPFDNQKKVTW